MAGFLRWWIVQGLLRLLIGEKLGRLDLLSCQELVEGILRSVLFSIVQVVPFADLVHFVVSAELLSPRAAFLLLDSLLDHAQELRRLRVQSWLLRVLRFHGANLNDSRCAKTYLNIAFHFRPQVDLITTVEYVSTFARFDDSSVCTVCLRREHRGPVPSSELTRYWWHYINRFEPCFGSVGLVLHHTADNSPGRTSIQVDKPHRFHRGPVKLLSVVPCIGKRCQISMLLLWDNIGAHLDQSSMGGTKIRVF